MRIGAVAGEDGTVEVLAAAMDHAVQTSQARDIDVEAPESIRSLLDRAVLGGYGGDGVASLIEVIRKPGS